MVVSPSFRLGSHTNLRRCVVFVKAFAACLAQLALVDVVLLEVAGVGPGLLVARCSDVVGGVEPDDVQHLQRAASVRPVAMRQVLSIVSGSATPFTTRLWAAVQKRNQE